MANDVDIIIGADSSKLQREVRDATQELDRLRTASERMTTSSVEMDRALAGAAKRLDTARTAAHRAGLELDRLPEIGDQIDDGMSRTAKAAALTGDAFGSLAGPIGDVGDAFAMMPPAMAATVVAAGAVISIFGSLVTTTLDVVRNMDDYVDVMDGTETNIYELRDSMTALDVAMKRQQVEIAEGMAPSLGFLANAYLSVSDNIGRALEWITNNVSKAISWISMKAVEGYDFVAGIAREMLDFVFMIAESIGDIFGVSDSTSRGVIDSIVSYAGSGIAAAFKPMQLAFDAMSAIMGQAERGRRIAKTEADAFNKQLTSQQMWTANFERMSSDWEKEDEERDKDKEDRLDNIAKGHDKVKEAAEGVNDEYAKFDPSKFTFQTSAEDVEVSQVMTIDFDAMDASMQTVDNYVEQVKQKNKDAAGDVKNIWEESAGALANASAGFATAITGLVSELASRNTANTRAERLKQFKTMKAAAIAEATINTFLGVTQSLGSAPFPVNVVLGALTLAAGGVQIGLIASQQPNFHRGGIMRSRDLAGDERAFSATTRANEAVVLTQQAMGAFAGQLSRVNAGDGMGGGMAPVYVMVDGRASPTRQFARPDPLYGRRRLA